MTAALGFGLCPFGTVPFGFGTPATFDNNIGSPLLKEDGSQGTAIFLDPATGDYVLNADTNEYIGMDVVEQMVYLALNTVRGSAFLETLGQGFSTIRVISKNIQVRVEDEVRIALSALISDKLIELVAVEVSVKQLSHVGKPAITIHWRNLADDELRETEL